MADHIVNDSVSGLATVIRRPKNSQVTLVNQSATAVYFDFEAQRLNRAVPGAVPNGTILPAAALGVPGSIQIDMHDHTMIWTRAAAQTVIEVQP